MRPYLRDIQVRLHDQERVQRVRTGRVRVVKEVLDLRERRLAEARSTILRRDVRLRVRLLQAERLRRVRERGHDPRVQRLHLLQACGEELALRRRPLVDPDPDEDLAQERKDA